MSEGINVRCIFVEMYDTSGVGVARYVDGWV
jgi:hypothetical protein